MLVKHLLEQLANCDKEASIYLETQNGEEIFLLYNINYSLQPTILPPLCPVVYLQDNSSYKRMLKDNGTIEC